MTPKEYLNQAYKIDRRIQITRAKADKLLSAITYKSPQFDSIGGTGNSSDKLGEAMAKVIDYKRKADELVNLLIDKRLEIERTISLLEDPVQREILERRYLLYQPWESRYDDVSGECIKGIAESMGYSQRQIFRLHGIALKKIKDVSECQ